MDQRQVADRNRNSPKGGIPSGDDTVPGDNSIDQALSNRLRIAISRVGSVSAAARLSHVPLGTINNYLAGRDLKRGALVAIADACNVSVEWLATGRGPILPPQGAVNIPDRPHDLERPDASRIVLIPRLNVTAAAGGGSLVDHEQVVDYIAYDRSFVAKKLGRDPEKLVLIEARGDSMEPTIRDGDILTVDVSQNSPLENGRLYVVRVDDILLVKRLEVRLGGTLIIHNDNPRYSSETVKKAELDQLHILGQVLLVSTPPR